MDDDDDRDDGRTVDDRAAGDARAIIAGEHERPPAPARLPVKLPGDDD